MSWFSAKRAPTLREKQIADLRTNPSIIAITEGSVYEAKYTNRFGAQSFTIELPPSFPQTAPVFQFRIPMAHQWVVNNTQIVSPSIRSWGAQSSINRVVQECIRQFVAVPPQPMQQNQQPPAFGQHQQGMYNQPPQYGQMPPQYGQVNNPPPPSYNQYNNNQFNQQQQQQGIRDSARSNVSHNSQIRNSAMSNNDDDEVERVDFEPPANFPILDMLEANNLQELLDNETSLRDYALDCQEYKGAREFMQATRQSLREDTAANLAREPDVSAERMRLEQARSEVSTVHKELENLQQRQKHILKRYSKEAIGVELDRLIMETQDQCRALRGNLENEEIKVVKYVNQLVKLKTLQHLRQIKRARLETL